MAFSSLTFVIIATCLASFANAAAITGPQGGVNTTTGQRPFRQEFSTFKNSGPAFDLYILSLQQFQQQNQSAPLSYYQVGGKEDPISVQRTTATDVCSRHSRTSIYRLGWCPRSLFSRLLHSQLYTVPIMASTLHGAL